MIIFAQRFEEDINDLRVLLGDEQFEQIVCTTHPNVLYETAKELPDEERLVVIASTCFDFRADVGQFIWRIIPKVIAVHPKTWFVLFTVDHMTRYENVEFSIPKWNNGIRTVARFITAAPDKAEAVEDLYYKHRQSLQ